MARKAVDPLEQALDKIRTDAWFFTWEFQKALDGFESRGRLQVRPMPADRHSGAPRALLLHSQIRVPPPCVFPGFRESKRTP